MRNGHRAAAPALPRRRFLCGAVLLVGSPRAVGQARARTYRIGYLSTRATHGPLEEAFLGGMRDLGYVVGRNLAIDYRWAGNDLNRLQSLADELARLDVDAIVTATTAGTRAAMRATRDIPIVMAATADPVGAGLIASLGRPGGNVTGVSLQTTDVAGKRVQLAREIVPDAARIALLVERVSGPAQGTTGRLVAETSMAARQVGAELVIREIATIDDLADAFAQFRRAQAQVLVVQVSPLMVEHRSKVVELAAHERLPAIYEARNFVEAGGFVSYGPDLAQTYRRAASYVDRIFKGAKPQDLPVEQPDKLALVVNLKSAKALGLTVPQSLLLRADEVIR